MWMSWCVNALYWWVLDPQLLAQCQARDTQWRDVGGPSLQSILSEIIFCLYLIT